MDGALSSFRPATRPGQEGQVSRRQAARTPSENTSRLATPAARNAYPFSAIVGQEEMKRALMIAAVEPSIGGVLVFGDRGTGKSTAVRSLAALLPEMGRIQEKVSALPVHHIPKDQVASIEKYIHTGDIIAITCRDSSAYTSHVGIAVRKADGTHLMHATSRRDKGRKVVLDCRISDYLQRSDDHFGIVIYRPLDLPSTSRNVATTQ